MRFMALALVVSLAGCAAPGHDNLRLRSVGQVAPSAAPAFTDCVADGFRAGQPALSRVRIEQSRRAGGMRIDETAWSILLVSADVADSGQVELRAGAGAGEQRVFAACLARYTM